MVLCFTGKTWLTLDFVYIGSAGQGATVEKAWCMFQRWKKKAEPEEKVGFLGSISNDLKSLADFLGLASFYTDTVLSKPTWMAPVKQIEPRNHRVRSKPSRESLALCCHCTIQKHFSLLEIENSKYNNYISSYFHSWSRSILLLSGSFLRP